MYDPTEVIIFPLTADEIEIAKNEGWRLVNIDPGGTMYAIEKMLFSENFNSDRQAWEHVISKAINNSSLHRKVIAFIKEMDHVEFTAHVRDAKIIEVAKLSHEDTANFTQPWQLLFTNSKYVNIEPEYLGFESKDKANAYLRHYRESVSLDQITGK